MSNDRDDAQGRPQPGLAGNEGDGHPAQPSGTAGGDQAHGATAHGATALGATTADQQPSWDGGHQDGAAQGRADGHELPFT